MHAVSQEPDFSSQHQDTPLCQERHGDALGDSTQDGSCNPARLVLPAHTWTEVEHVSPARIGVGALARTCHPSASMDIRPLLPNKPLSLFLRGSTAERCPLAKSWSFAILPHYRVSAFHNRASFPNSFIVSSIACREKSLVLTFVTVIIL